MSIKSFVAAAALTLFAASAAYADAPVSATLQAPVAAQSRVVAGGAVWSCEGNTCVTVSSSDRANGVAACRELTKAVGAVTAFGNDKRALDAEALTRCNASARAR